MPETDAAARLRVSTRGGVTPFHVMRVIDAVAARRALGLPVIDLSAGQPSTPAPAPVRAAASRTLEIDRIGYTTALGIPALRAGIAGHYRHAYGLDVDPASVAVTTGSSGGFLYAFLAAFDPGDTVVMARPGYPAYRNMLTALGCRVVELPCAAETRFQPTVAQLDALDEPPAGLVLASPANPTGTMVDSTELAALTGWCDAHGTRLISDEIYHGITYATAGASAWATSRSAVVVNSFSKYFSMTGWRIGWLLVPDDLRDPVDRLAGNFAICPPALSQHAAVAAFDAYDELDANVARYATNRALALDGLRSIGMDRLAPADGAFYVYADVSRWTTDSMVWVRRLLDDTGVALVPGLDFDPVDGGRFVRMCFAGDGAEITRAIDLLGALAAATVIDEASRPTAPASDAPVSELGRRIGDHLREVHDMYRGELDQVRDVLDQLRGGHTGVAEARDELQRVALLANNWAFGGVCQRYCFALTQHHELESGQIFPYLRRAEPALAPVLDRLHDEHDVIHHLIGDIDAALVRLAAAPADLAPVEAAVETLDTTIRSHFTYEERELSGPLARHGFFPGQV